MVGILLKNDIIVNAATPLPIDEKFAYLFSKYPVTPDKRGQLTNMLNIITDASNKVLYLYNNLNSHELRDMVYNMLNGLHFCYLNISKLETAIRIESTHENDNINKNALRLIELERIKSLEAVNGFLTYTSNLKDFLQRDDKNQKEDQEIIQCINDIQKNIVEVQGFIVSLENVLIANTVSK